MKLIESKLAPNCRRVRIFLAEKDIQIPIEQIDIVKGENRKELFLNINPMGEVPVLELDDGHYLSESLAICRYFEEKHPDPNLMGRNPREKAEIEMWGRRMEFELFIPIAQVFRNQHEFFKGRIEQVPEYGDACRRLVEKRLAWLDSVLAEQSFITGNNFSVADITALVGIDFGRVSKIRIDAAHENLNAWYERVSSRPSAGV